MIDDLRNLRQGNPPRNVTLLRQMTIGREFWLDRFKSHYLENYINVGGSKVKVLIGDPGSGKTHLLRCVQADAYELGYSTVYFSAREHTRLSNIPELYRAIVSQIDIEAMIKGLCCRVADEMGFGTTLYDGSGSLLRILIEEERLVRSEAIRELRQATSKIFKNVDLGPPFAVFAYNVVRDRMSSENHENLRLATKWLSGDKLDRKEKQQSLLFENLQKSNARSWLNSLIRLLVLSGKAGLVVIIDDLEVLTERKSDGNYAYSPNAVKDTCELFRQVIDDVDMLNHLLLLLAGRRTLIETGPRSFQSYEALWMRLQTGLVDGTRFNPFADIVDVDLHLAKNGTDFLNKVISVLDRIMQEQGLARKSCPIPDLSGHNALRSQIMETAYYYSSGAGL